MRVVSITPAGSALLLRANTALARITTLELGQHNEVVELVHNVSLLVIPVSLNDKAIARLVVERVAHLI